MTKCSLKNCHYVYKKGDGVKLHRFPINIERRNEWIKMVNEPNFEPGPKSILCSKHFATDCYIRNVHGNIILKPDAIPTIFPSQDDTMCTEIVIDTNQEDIENINYDIENVDEFEEVIEIFTEETVENEIQLEETAEDQTESYCIVDDTQEEIIPVDPSGKYNEIYVTGPDGAIVAIIEEPIKSTSSISSQENTNRRFPCMFSEFCYEDLECPVKRQKFWEVAQAMKATSTQKSQRDAKYIASLRSKVVKLQDEIYNLKNSKRILVYSYNKKKVK